MAREITYNNFEIIITRGISAKYHYKINHAITYTNQPMTSKVQLLCRSMHRLPRRPGNKVELFSVVKTKMEDIFFPTALLGIPLVIYNKKL